jgi:mycothiol system anti-sigma-R factor
MTCGQFYTHASSYVDGELGVSETLAAQAHLAECAGCRSYAEREQQFRELLRRQPREAVPPELRARILARCRREARRARALPLLVPGLTGLAAAALVAALLLPGVRPSHSVLAELVATHIAFADIERPAEVASTDPGEVEAWLRERAGLRAIVPDYSSAGIQLVGARLANVEERRAAFVLYRKGHTLLSVFMIPAAHEVDVGGSRVTYRGQVYLVEERRGYRTVAWSDGQAVFGLVSLVDSESLLECADTLRQERASRLRA